MENETYTTPEGRSFRFNDLVVAEMLMGVADDDRIGRLVQVRKGAGAFKSDLLSIRRKDGSLMMFSNVLLRRADDKEFENAFYRHNNRNPPVIHDESEYEKDAPGNTYTIKDEYPETGFIIEKPAQPDDPTQSFTMIVKLP